MATSTTAIVPARDGTPLLTQRWLPTGEPWAHVLLVHGLAEHSGRYTAVADWLTGAGIAVDAFDVRGFGASGGRRAWVDRWSRVHDDLEDRLAATRLAAGAGPVVLFGHSLGGLIALGYCVADPPRPLPDVLVLSAPALESSIPAWRRTLARALSRLLPTISVSNGLDRTALSRDPAVGDAYVRDPRNHHRTTTRFGAEALTEQERVRTALARLAVPTLVYHGEDDRIVPVAASEPLATLPGVERRTWPGLRHESHNEPEGEAVIGAVVAWLRSVLQSRDN